ncbi:hypothetical protein GGR56DRAFT_310445 [Xylariaceae sp. FL0804]|nr:hypothetical protein GGR56DRAFT_310445 [Xylariaceae sp. FL0804]
MSCGRWLLLSALSIKPTRTSFISGARQYAEADEMKGQGEHFITVAHAQAWCIMATYEAKTMRFTRAAMSGARAIRLVHILGLHMLDSPHEDSEAPSLVPPKDWAELEERRRTFWGVFTIDSHCSVSTGWPNLLDSSQSESAFHSGEAVETCTLHDVFKGWHSYSSFGGFAVVCHIFNQLLQHVHRPKPNDNPGDFEHGDYWKRHRDIDNILSNTFMFLPEFFRLPENYRDPTAVHTNLNLHAGVICLHIAAAEKIDDYNLPEQAKAISLNRLRTSAQEIVDIIKLTSHLRSGPKSPLAALSLYVAASASIYMCQEMRTPTSADNLNFIISAMEAIGRDHHVTRGFLGQVLADIEHSGIQAYVQIPRLDNWKADFNAGFTPHNIPLLARSRVSRHSKRQPPLPGRLPLGKPMGKVISEDGGTRDLWHSPPATADCPFASYTGEKSSDGNANKRKRTASSTPGGASGHSEPLFHGSNDLTDSSRTATSSSHSSPQDTLNALSSVQSTTSANLASSGAETLKLPHRVWSPAWNNMSMDQKEAQACHDPSPRRRANDQSNFDAGFGSIFAGPGQSQLPQKSREVEASEWSTAGLDIPSQPKPDTGTALHTAIRADAGAFNFIRPEDLTLDWNEFGANFGMSETPTGPGLKDGVPTGQGK